MVAVASDEEILQLATVAQAWKADPVAFVGHTFREDPEGNPVVIDAPQRDILRAIAQNDRVAVRSSHGIGKTTTAAWTTLWWLSTRKPALVVTLAGTWNHLSKKLWPEIHTWGQHWRLNVAFEFQTLGIYSKHSPTSWRAEAASSDKPEFIEGWHSPNLLIIIDEAKALPDEVWAAIRGALTSVSRGGARPKVLVLSTPPSTPSGWYPDLFGKKSEGWYTLHFGAHHSARVDQAWVEEMARDYGESSAIYQSKVLGEIPEGAAEAVIQTRWVEEAQARGVSKADRRRAVITCDVAREGEDLTALGKIVGAKHHIIEWKASNDLMEAAGMCRRAVIDADAAALVIDDTGVGGGVTDRLHEMQRNGQFPRDCAIMGVKFGSKADRDDRFHSCKDELWWTARNALRDGKIALQTQEELAALHFPRGSDLRSQLTAPIYEEDSLNRLRVLDHRGSYDNREAMRALPRKSPDLAHTLILGMKAWMHMREEVIGPANPVEALRNRVTESIQKKVAKLAKERAMVKRRGWSLPGM